MLNRTWTAIGRLKAINKSNDSEKNMNLSRRGREGLNFSNFRSYTTSEGKNRSHTNEKIENRI